MPEAAGAVTLSLPNSPSRFGFGALRKDPHDSNVKLLPLYSVLIV